MGAEKRICPPHIDAIQLTNLMPVGTAMRNESPEKNGSSTSPVTNMWCAHTPTESAAMAMVANTSPA